MKRIVECEDGGLEGLLGKTVIVFACRYIYRGTLVGVNDFNIELGDDSGIVYETGPLDGPSKDFQAFPNVSVAKAAIESFKEYTF